MGQDKPSLIDLKKLFPVRTVVAGQWYNSQNVPLDGYHFQNCRFDNCKLMSSSGDFQMTNCYIAETNRIFFPANLTKPVKLLLHKQKLTGESDEIMPIFQIKENDDGTISI